MSISASLLSSENPMSLFIARPFSINKSIPVEIDCKHAAIVILWHLSKMLQSKHLYGGSPWSISSACCPKHSLESHSFFIIISHIANEKFTGREPNTVGLRATFNSKGAMEKGHPGFPVECETPGYVSITAASSLEDRQTNFACWPFVRNNLRIAGSF